MAPCLTLHMGVFALLATTVQLAQRDHMNIPVQMEPTVTHLALRERTNAFHAILEGPVQEKD